MKNLSFVEDSRSAPKYVAGVPCTGCGHKRHVVATCRSKSTQFFNSLPYPYKGSVSYKSSLWSMYPGTLAILFEDLPKDPSRSSAGSTASSSKYVPKPLDITSTIWTTNPNSNYVDASLSSLSQVSTTTRRKVKSLLDTGSLAGDFISFWTLNDQRPTPGHFYYNKYT